MNITQDGFMSGPHCELDWHFKYWTTEMAETLCDELRHADTIILGRITYMAMAAHWSYRAQDLSRPVEDRAFAEMMNRYKKIVFSKSPALPYWQNALQVKEPPAVFIDKLKQQEGGALILYGSGQLVKELIDGNLVDEYQLWVHPEAIGQGKPLFRNPDAQNLELVKSHRFRSGVVLFYYKAERKA